MATTYLTRTPGSAGNRKTWTWSGWIKRALLSSGNQVLFEGISGGFPEKLQFTSSDRLEYDHDIAGTDYTIYSSAQYRDPSAWYHVIFAKDTTQTTETNRIKVYVNGEQIAMTEESLGYPPEDYEGQINNSVPQYLGSNASSEYFNGSMANVEMVDGLQLTPAYFGSTDSNTGIWKPGGSSTISDYGTNGFKLAMDTTSPGADTSGKGNTFTPSGAPTLLQGSPSNVWCTWNPLIPDTTNYVYSNGNNTVNQTSSSWVKTVSTMGVTKGKWYWEVKSVDNDTSAGKYTVVGVANTTTSTAASGMPANGIGYKSNGEVQRLGAITNIGAYTAGNIISCYLDMDNEALYYAKNGVMLNSGVPTSGASKTGAFTMPVANSTYFASLSTYGSKAEANFGEGFFGTTAAGTQADDNGQGLFAYDVPAGYYALNTKNLEAYG